VSIRDYTLDYWKLICRINYIEIHDFSPLKFFRQVDVNSSYWESLHNKQVNKEGASQCVYWQNPLLIAKQILPFSLHTYVMSKRKNYFFMSTMSSKFTGFFSEVTSYPQLLCKDYSFPWQAAGVRCATRLDIALWLLGVRSSISCLPTWKYWMWNSLPVNVLSETRIGPLVKCEIQRNVFVLSWLLQLPSPLIFTIILHNLFISTRVGSEKNRTTARSLTVAAFLVIFGYLWL